MMGALDDPLHDVKRAEALELRVCVHSLPHDRIPFDRGVREHDAKRVESEVSD